MLHRRLPLIFAGLFIATNAALFFLFLSNQASPEVEMSEATPLGLTQGEKSVEPQKKRSFFGFSLPRAEEGIPPQQEITLLAFGDIMLNRHVRLKMDEKGLEWPFANIKTLLPQADITVANLEGSISEAKPLPVWPDHVRFTFDPSVAPLLSGLGFDVLSLANNHTRDFGNEALAQTKTHLTSANIQYFGDYFNKEEISVIKEVHGLKMGFVGLNDITAYFRGATAQEVNLVLEEIKKLKQEGVDYVFMYPHWGTEYKQYAFDKRQQDLARQFIDAGADAVIGAHPHVVQPLEIYKNKPIFYSLGNFIFDQQFSQAVKNGLGLKITITPEKMAFSLLPYRLNADYQVELYDQEKSSKFFIDYARVMFGNDEIKTDVEDGVFSLKSSASN